VVSTNSRIIIKLSLYARSGHIYGVNAHGKTQTEQDFAQIAGAGLNYVRIPLPYWAIETRSGEPFLAKTSWKCVLTCPDIFLNLIDPQVFS
jgi:aryl-phospho-beta-D-glucosidase BglC (GH1 family)